MSFNIIIKTPGLELPALRSGELRYVFGRDGLNLERCTPMYTSSVKVDGPIPFLDEHPQKCQLHCGTIPAEMLRQMVGFFQAAYEMHGGEAALVLLYYAETGEFAWHCPRQTIQMYSWWGKWYPEDSVEYDNPLSLPEGAVHFGDAHSHIGPPTPSFVDQKDEAHLDGLHIIVGYINSQRPSWHLDFCIDGNRFSVPTDVILEAVPESPFPTPPEAWMKQIQIVYPKSHAKSTTGSNWGGSADQAKNDSSNYSTSSYHAKSSFHSNGSSRKDSADTDEEDNSSATSDPKPEAGNDEGDNLEEDES